MSTLYQLTGEMLQLQQMIDEGYDPQTIADTMESIDYEIEKKADGYAKLMRNLQTEADGLAKEIERLTARRQYLDNQVRRLKDNLQESMKKIGKEKFRTELFSFGICQNPPKIVIDKPESIPKRFLVKQDPKLDTKAAKEYLKEKKVVWGHLEQSASLRIR